MNNSQIAEVFQNIAGLLEMKGEPGYTVRAYRQAAGIISQLPEQACDMLHRGEDLREFPGIGKAIPEKTGESVDTGELRFYERLKAEFPAGIPQMLRVPGLGPKTTLRIWKELGVTTFSELEQAIEDGKLAALPRVGKKTAENIPFDIRTDWQPEDPASKSRSV